MKKNWKYLISAYTTGALSRQEEDQLLEAALSDQEIFDGLVEEESWRQIFSMPEVRADLLTALGTPSPSPGLLERLGQWFDGVLRPVPLALGTAAAAALVAIVLVPYWLGVGAPGAESPDGVGGPQVVEAAPGEPGAAPPGAVDLVPKTYTPGAPPPRGSEPVSGSVADTAAPGVGETAPAPRRATRSMLEPKSVGGDTMTLSYSLELNQPSGPRRVPADYRFQPQDQFRLRLEVDFVAWLYLFNRAADEDVYAVLYPLTRAEQEPAPPNRELLLPEEVWLTMDATPGDEELVLVVASSPWPAFRFGPETVPAPELGEELRRAEEGFESMSWRRSVVENRVGLEVVREEEGLVAVVRLLGG